MISARNGEGRKIHVFRCGGPFTALRISRAAARGGQRHAQLIGEVQREAHILVHQAQRKARLVFALEHHRRLDVQHAGAAHARLHHFEKFFARNSRSRDERQRLRERFHLQCKHQVHREFHGLSRADRPQMEPRLPIAPRTGSARLSVSAFAADHEHQLALFRSPGPARHRRFQKFSAVCSRAAAAARFSSSGVTVLDSTSTLPRRSPANTPVLPTTPTPVLADR